MNNQDYILTISDLKTQFKVGKRVVKAVDGVTLNVVVENIGPCW